MIGGTAPFLVVVLLEAGGLPVAARVDGERAVERARYKFVIGNTQPFDEVYPRSVFEKRVEREMAEERILEKTFGLTVTPALLPKEFDRIEKETKAPDQWEAIQKALGNDRRLIEEVFCRPLVVERALRAKFAFDQRIHARPHQKARKARANFLAEKSVRGATVVVIRRRGGSAPTTEELLDGARKEASLPRVLAPSVLPAGDARRSVDPEMAAVLERELKRPGDVTTILEERDRFSVFRLLSKTSETWTVEAVTFPKVDFDAWFERERSAS